MNDTSNVIVKVEYEREGMRRVYFGEIEKIKLDNFDDKNENFIWMKNDVDITWIDKQSILSIDELTKTTNLYERSGVNPISQKQDVSI